jgi:hypothetical protein
MDKKIQIFVSSTYLDLKDERQAAVEAILKAGHIPAGMELFTAGNQSQFEVIKRWIDESDAYLLILGGRYGSIEPTTSLSYIELEYDYAFSNDKPLFAIVITDEALDDKIKRLGSIAIEKDNQGKLKEFRTKVLSKMSSFFKDSKDIKLAIHESLSDMLQRNDFVGWIKGDKFIDNKVLLEEINSLKTENKQLVDSIKKEKEKNIKSEKKFNPDVKEEFDELINLFKETKIKTTIFNKEGDTKPQEKTIFYIIYIFREALVTGVDNKYNASTIATFLFFKILPKLEIHNLAAQEKVAGAQWKNYKLSKRGLEFIAYVERQTNQNKKSKSS